MNYLMKIRLAEEGSQSPKTTICYERSYSHLRYSLIEERIAPQREHRMRHEKYYPTVTF